MQIFKEKIQQYRDTITRVTGFKVEMVGTKDPVQYVCFIMAF